MAEDTREMTPAHRLRRRLLIGIVAGWAVLDIFDGLFVPQEAREHWLEAAWWFVAAAGYLLLARRRPLPSPTRFGDGVIASGMAAIGATLVLRATLPDADAFRWSIVLMGGYLGALVLLGRRRARAARTS